MTSLRTLLLTTLTLLACTACAGADGSAPTKEEELRADYGIPPLDPGRRIVPMVRERYASRSVVDVKVGRAKRGWVRESRLLRKKATVWGWSVPFTGSRLGAVSLDDPVVRGYAFFRNDELIGFADEDGFQFLEGNAATNNDG